MTTMTYSKPTKVPRWADTTSNVSEPSSGEKDTGWAVGAIHPSSYQNWISRTVGEWFKWINERLVDGATIDDLKAVVTLEVDVSGVAATNADALTTKGKGSGSGGEFEGGNSGGTGVVGRGKGLASGGAFYGGSGVHNPGGCMAEPTPWQGQPYSLNLTLPPLGMLVFKVE